jgi:hypothetical protein
LVMSAEWSTLDSLLPFLSCTEICGRGNTHISGFICYGYIWSLTWLSQTELGYVCRVKYTWLTSSFFSCTEICFRRNTDNSAINNYVYVWSVTWLSQTELGYVCRVEYTLLTSSLPLLHRDMCPS